MWVWGENSGVEAHSLIRNTLGVEGHAKASKWDYENDNQSIIHTDLHKPNNKLVSA
jgi:hypothetical protein